MFQITELLLVIFISSSAFCTPFLTTIAPAPHRANSQCDLNPVQSQIERFENQFSDKINILRNEIRDGSRRVQNLEYQNSGIKNAVDECKSDVRRFVVERSRRYNPPSIQGDNFENRLENVAKGLQLTVATLRLLLSDVEAIKGNLSDFFNSTNSILERLDTEINVQTLFKSSPDSSPATSRSSPSIPKSCREIGAKRRYPQSGIYLVRPESSDKPFPVYCDMETRDGGWLTIHNRFRGSQDFYLDWQEYRAGFGNVAGEFWLGLEKIYQLTGSQINELLIELVDTSKVKTFAFYSYFSIGSEDEGYPIKVLGGYEGNAGDSLIYHAGSKFSTKDQDHDSWLEGNCAKSHGGAWWYKACDTSNLNAKYLPGELPDAFLYQGMYWGDFGGPQVGLLQARMMIRPRGDGNGRDLSHST